MPRQDVSKVWAVVVPRPLLDLLPVGAFPVLRNFPECRYLFLLRLFGLLKTVEQRFRVTIIKAVSSVYLAMYLPSFRRMNIAA